MLVPLEKPTREVKFGGIEIWLQAATPKIDKSLKQSITDCYMLGAIFDKKASELTRAGKSDKSRKMKMLGDKWNSLASALDSDYKNHQRILNDTMKILQEGGFDA